MNGDVLTLSTGTNVSGVGLHALSRPDIDRLTLDEKRELAELVAEAWRTWAELS